MWTTEPNRVERSGPTTNRVDPAPTEGVRVTPLSQANSLFPPSRIPRTGTALWGSPPRSSITPSPTPSRPMRVWERYAIPAPGNWVWEYGLIANFRPGHQDTWVDYKADRA